MDLSVAIYFFLRCSSSKTGKFVKKEVLIVTIPLI